MADIPRVGRRVASTHKYYVRRSHREETRALLVLVLFVVALVGFQAFLVNCRKRHDALYIGVSLAGLWVIPAFGATWLMWPWTLLVWSAFTLVVGHVMFLATRKELAQTTPRTVYAFFSAVTRSCFALGVAGYALMIVDFLHMEELVGLRGYVAPLGGTLLCYGLYLGVLTRDCASLTSELMASRMGFSARDEESRRELAPTACCVCGGELVVAGAARAGDDHAAASSSHDELAPLIEPASARIENPFEGCLDAAQPEPIVTLECGHRYHEQCIRGWTLIGKKDTCAYCCERVELKQVFPWERHSLLWLQLLDAIRYLIVWNPIIIVFVDSVLPLVAGRGGGSIGGY
ncbi:hypothetical protein KFE25_010659 [Diacronema lutheri]|uniref:RING-type domain-containing protein n=2 Tax=Diacronema lutheri TaxID=2081491 RepID=A0A8J5X764_DIALT|nr:hypothetical protein KFE25_010659 [Diacronema lutheri]